MANPQTHFRSISFPSRFHQINPTNYETQLKKLNFCEISITSQTIQSGLVDLAKLYNSVQKLTQSPTTQEDAKSIEESLSSSIELLDACTTIRELFQMMKENIHALQSSFRRKLSLESSVQNDVASYFSLRRRMNKCITKTLQTLKNLEQLKNGTSVNRDKSCTSLLRELIGVTIAIFKSILNFLSMPISRPGGWALVSKVMNIKTMSCENEVTNEVRNVDFALNSLQGQMRSSEANVVEVQMVQKRLQNLEVTIEGFEGGLERLFRQLVQCRVTLLNVLTDN